MKLTAKQLEALVKLSEAQQSSAYAMRVSLKTLEALSARGLVRSVGFGHMAFPRSASWKITTAGRDALGFS